MQREIKFKAVGVSSNEWIHGMTIGGGLIKRKSRNIYMEISQDNWREIRAETLCQFTGMIDKNQVEIFEGDIYHHGDINIRYEVIFRDGCFIGKQIGNNSLSGLSHFIQDIEVIGNKHTVFTLKAQELIGLADWVKGLNASGFAGVRKGDGMIVDRREFNDAVPVQANRMFGVLEPKDLPNG